MIAAVVLAAGSSRRMGRAKMVLPWGETTVIGRVVSVLAEAGVGEIRVVTGGARREVEAALESLPVRAVFNPRFEQDQMATSLQVGLGALGEEVEAALVTLGDQPQIEADVVRGVIAAFSQRGAALVVPSYRMRRGHPWLVSRGLWPGIMALEPHEQLRDFLNAHAGEIHYLAVETESVLKDLDTPDDYRRERPGEPGDG